MTLPQMATVLKPIYGREQITKNICGLFSISFKELEMECFDGPDFL